MYSGVKEDIRFGGIESSSDENRADLFPRD